MVKPSIDTKVRHPDGAKPFPGRTAHDGQGMLPGAENPTDRPVPGYRLLRKCVLKRLGGFYGFWPTCPRSTWREPRGLADLAGPPRPTGREGTNLSRHNSPTCRLP